MSDAERSVLIAYDGSGPALEAIEQAARLFPGSRALIATAWHSVRHAAGAARAGLPDDIIGQAIRNLDAAAEAEACRTAEEGAETAQLAGMHATPLTVRAEPSVWASLVNAADEHDARTVIVGSRGRSGLRSAVLGSVSIAVVHHCRRPVIVVHPTDVNPDPG